VLESWLVVGRLVSQVVEEVQASQMMEGSVSWLAAPVSWLPEEELESSRVLLLEIQMPEGLAILTAHWDQNQTQKELQSQMSTKQTILGPVGLGRSVEAPQKNWRSLLTVELGRLKAKEFDQRSTAKELLVESLDRAGFEKLVVEPRAKKPEEEHRKD
jgi:hypothetical protein